MIATFDSHSGIVYIQVQAKKEIKKTVEFDSDTILELDGNNELIAIEMIKPKAAILNRIAKKFGRWELGRVNLDYLRKSID